MRNLKNYKKCKEKFIINILTWLVQLKINYFLK